MGGDSDGIVSRRSLFAKKSPARHHLIFLRFLIEKGGSETGRAITVLGSIPTEDRSIP